MKNILHQLLFGLLLLSVLSGCDGILNSEGITRKFSISIKELSNIGNNKIYMNNSYIQTSSGYDAIDSSEILLWSGGYVLNPGQTQTINKSSLYVFSVNEISDAYMKLHFTGSVFDFHGSFSVGNQRIHQILQVFEDIANDGYPGDNPDGYYHLDCHFSGSLIGDCSLRIYYTITYIK